MNGQASLTPYSQEHRIYDTRGRADSNSPGELKLQEVKGETIYRHNSVLTYMYSPCLIAVADPKAHCGAFGSSKVKRKNLNVHTEVWGFFFF